MASHPSPTATQPLRIGTRGSKLARWQAQWVADALRSGGLAVEIVEISTLGDQLPSGSLTEIGRDGVFTKEIQRALLAGAIDVAVHSLKDLPTERVDGLNLAAVPRRASTADVLISRHNATLDSLARGACVGTGSLRRVSQLLHARPDLQIKNIRGNVDTRLRALDSGRYDAIVLAQAGLVRLGLAERVAHVLPPEVMLPAVGQGALAIECRQDDSTTLNAVAALDDAESHQAVAAERRLLAHLCAGCMAPVGAWGRFERGTLKLAAAVLSHDGSQRIFHQEPARDGEEPASLGQRVAEALLNSGAGQLIAKIRDA